MFYFPKKGYHCMTTMFFRTALPMALGNCYLFSMSKFIGNKFSLINTSTVDNTSSEDCDEDELNLKD
jgi:hypothetical protein